MLRKSDFDYELDKKYIAQEQVKPRDSAKLMLIDRKTEKISHHHVRDLRHLIPTEYFLVVNNTKVFPSRLHGSKKTGGKVEILLLEKLSGNTYSSITKPGLEVGDTVVLTQELKATCTKKEERVRVLEFNESGDKLRSLLEEIGEMPTPPYIKKYLKNDSDYQTIYAKHGMSSAAPTAGLHFTPSLFKELKQKNNAYELNLNVGLGTFLSVKEERVENHKMHSEHYTITAQLADKLNQEKDIGRKALAIGTTTARALESSVNDKVYIKEKSEYTDIFIYPPYKFKFVDALLTNFHLPESTLLMMVAALTSWPNASKRYKTYHGSLVEKIYETAKNEGYRFYSFGDAMLII